MSKPSFIVPLFVQTNSFSGEQLAVGLLAISDNKVFFKYSDKKLNTAKTIAENKDFQLVKKLLEANQQADDNYSIIDLKYNEDYFNYLHQYSNGLLKFDTPKPISGIISKEKFEQLFEQFIAHEEHKQVKTGLHEQLKSLSKKYELKKKADVDYILKPEIFKGLYKNEKLALITKNGAVQATQIIDFNGAVEYNGNELYALDVINHSLSEFCKNKHLALSKIKILFSPVHSEHQTAEKLKFFNDTYHTLKSKYQFQDDACLDSYLKEISLSDYTPFSQAVNAS